VRAAIVATATSRATVGSHVLQAFARTPLATALAATELQEVSGGRFILGLGSQFPAANRRWHGLEIDRPITALGEYIAAVRALLQAPQGATVEFDGRWFTYRVPPFRSATDSSPPIWVGGAGPGSVRLAARTADGLAGHLLWTYRHVRQCVRPVLPDASMPVTVARLVASTTQGRAAGYRRLAHYLATPGYQDLLVHQGTPVDRSGLLSALRSGDHAALERMLAGYAHEWLITDAAGLDGHRRAAAAAGVTRLMLLAPVDQDDPQRTAGFENDLASLLEAG
jgi:alkanesulfonate monooxygenase SsuD/methylene tetrahydromethanopterin reductase-like flavin-dependent oxidoreductase (luciferase family)